MYEDLVDSPIANLILDVIIYYNKINKEPSAYAKGVRGGFPSPKKIEKKEGENQKNQENLPIGQM